MSIFKPFIWMFETENFGKRIAQLFAVTVLLYILSIACFFAGNMLNGCVERYFLYSGSILFFIASWLILQGYFWELTSNVISRDVDIAANNIYSGKIKNVYTVHLPDFKPMTFLWRGIASVVASILMVLPYALLVFSTTFTGTFLLPWDNINTYHSTYALSYNLLYLFFFIFMPAMLWNYAKQNSVVAVWNVRKAVFIIENYFFKYVGHTILFVLVYVLNCFVLFCIYNILTAWNVNDVCGLLLYFISAVIYLYTLHIYAYLLGTITPVCEG